MRVFEKATPVWLAKLNDELVALIGVATNAAGRRLPLHSLTHRTLDGITTLTVFDGATATDGEIQAVLDAHDPTPPAPVTPLLEIAPGLRVAGVLDAAGHLVLMDDDGIVLVDTSRSA